MKYNLKKCKDTIKRFYIPKTNNNEKLTEYQKKICQDFCVNSKNCKEWILFLESLQRNIKIKDKYMKLGDNATVE